MVAGAQSPAPAPASEAPTFRGGTNDIVVDVVVRDKRGRPVHGLTQGQFALSEDGTAQQIASFREVRAAVPGEAVPGEAPADRIKVQQQPRLVMMVFERLGLQPRGLARQAAQDFLKTDMGPNVYYSASYVDRRLTILQPYTANMELLRRAIDRATSTQAFDFSSDNVSVTRMIEANGGSSAASTGEAEQSGPPSGGTVDGGALSSAQAVRMAQNIAEMSSQISREDLGRLSIFSLWAVIKQMSHLPGRKSILYFTEGVEIPNGLWQQYETMIAAANLANVTIYTIDARGLLAGSDQGRSAELVSKSAQNSYRVRSQTTDGAQEFRGFDDAVDSLRANKQQVLNELAVSTGGFMIANTNDMRPQLKRLSEDFNSYYELIYHPLDNSYDGRFRKIEVKTDHSDHSIQARNGYFSLPPMEGQTVYRYEIPMLKALSQQPLPRGLDFRAGVLHFRPTAQGEQATLIFDLPLSSITFVKDEKAKVYKTHVSVLTLIKDERGQVIEKLSRDTPFEQALDKVDALEKGRYIITRPVQLAPGRYVIESAVLDRQGNRIAAKRASLYVPSRGSTTPAISSLMLVRRVGPKPEQPDPSDPLQVPAGMIVPTLADSVPAKNSMLSVFFLLYPDSTAEAPQLVLDLMRDGQLLSRSTPSLPAAEQGSIPYLANTPLQNVPPGQYEFRATLVQGQRAAQQSLYVNIE